MAGPRNRARYPASCVSNAPGRYRSGDRMVDLVTLALCLSVATSDDDGFAWFHPDGGASSDRPRAVSGDGRSHRHLCDRTPTRYRTCVLNPSCTGARSTSDRAAAPAPGSDPGVAGGAPRESRQHTVAARASHSPPARYGLAAQRGSDESADRGPAVPLRAHGGRASGERLPPAWGDQPHHGGDRITQICVLIAHRLGA